MATTTTVLCFRLLLVFTLSACASTGQEYVGVCDKTQNAQLPFCDSNLSFDARVQDLLGRLTLDEKIGLLDHTSAGASTNVELDEYNWWNEALHGVAGSPGTQFRPPTEYATVFPQIISLAASFNKQLFFEMGNVTGNEARVFFHSGNSGLTFWSPDINIFRDPRWGRGHETPGEDPHLSGEYAKAFVRGMQGDEYERGFLKTGACCKHFSAHSAEEGRFSFNSIVTAQDMADTYLPAFKTCVQDAGVACVMCSYNSINGVPACAHKELLTGTVREKWGLDGYITADCDAGAWVDLEHHYTNSTSETCRTLLDAGMDLECYYFVRYFEQYLRQAVDDGTVPVQLIDTALTRLLRVLMRMGYFEKDATRPYKELVPDMVDSQPHQALALQAARESIVLLKNAPNVRTGQPPLPIHIDTEALKAGRLHARASMAAIGPYITGGESFLGNYHGRPSFIKEPVDEIRKFVPDLEWERGCNVSNFDNPRLQEAENLAASSAQVVLLVGTSPDLENEGRDRPNLTLPGLQDELIRRVLAVTQEPVIMLVVSGGAIGLEEWKNDPRVGAIIWAGYLGQSAGEAMADVLFGAYNPAGRLTQSFYSSEFVDQVSKFDMNMRPVNGSPGRTYRFFQGEPVYTFGHGLSYTTFEYAFTAEAADISTPSIIPTLTAEGDCSVEVNVTVRNSGQRAGDHSVLWFISPPNAGQMGRPIKNLLDFERLNNVQVLESRQVKICLNRDDFHLANEEGEFEVVTGEWKLTVGSLERGVLVL